MRVHYQFLLILFLLLIGGCSPKDKDASIPKTENDTLNTLLTSAPGTVINLNSQPVDTLFATAKNIMGDTSADRFSEPARLGRVVQMVKVGDSLYVADQQQSCIWVLDGQGTIIRKVGRKGRGPGEFNMLMGLFKNSEHIYTIDPQNARIQLFNSSLQLINSYSTTIYETSVTGLESIAITDSFLILPTDYYVNDKLVAVRVSVAPFDSLTSFLPRIIPPGMQPGPYNNFSIDANKSGKVAVAYSGLPYIFLFNSDYKLQHVLFIRFPYDDRPDNPSTKPTTENARSGVRVTSLITGLDLKDNGDLYFDLGGKFHRLATNSNEEEYGLKNSWFFTFKDAQKRKANELGINPTTITVAGNKVYLGSIFKEHIYRFSLNK